MTYRIKSECEGATGRLAKHHKALIESLGYTMKENLNATFINIPYGELEGLCRHVFDALDKAVRFDSGMAEITILEDKAY